MARVSIVDNEVQIEDAPHTPRLDLFFRVVLGGHRVETTWHIPRRRESLEDVAVRVARQLETEGIEVDVAGAADRALGAAIERVRSFTRAREAVIALRHGRPTLDRGSLNDALTRQGWNSDQRALLAHQEEGLMHSLTAINAANFSVPGAGKTAIALASLAVHLEETNVDLALVVGPLSSFAPWERETSLALPGVLRVRRVRGDREARRESYVDAGHGDLLLLTYPTVAIDLPDLLALTERLRAFLVVDESHRVKRFRGGLWATAIQDLATRCRVRLILSGTPMPQGPEDLYSQLNILWPDHQLTGSRAQFQSRASHDFDGLVSDIAPFFVRTSKDELGIPPYIVTEHPVEMSSLQGEIYDLIVGRFRRALIDAPLWQDKLDVLRRGRPIRLIQASSNPDLLNQEDGFFRLPPLDHPGATLLRRLHEYREREIPAKITAALDLLATQQELGEKTVVWTTFIRNIDQFQQLVRTRLGMPTWAVDGRVPAATESEPTPNRPDEEIDSTREQRIQNFLGAEGPAVLIANPAACGESISLHEACRTAIYLDRTYDCARYLQSIDRIHRLGLPQDAIVNVHLLQATRGNRPAVDDLVAGSLERKRNRMERLLMGAELLPANLAIDEARSSEGDQQDLGELLAYLLGE